MFKPINSKMIVYNIKIERVNKFNFLGNDVSYKDKIDVDKEIKLLNYINGTVYANLRNKEKECTLVNFYKTIVIPSLLYSSETWKLTETNENTNTNSRGKIATEGRRLHKEV